MIVVARGWAVVGASSPSPLPAHRLQSERSSRTQAHQAVQRLAVSGRTGRARRLPAQCDVCLHNTWFRRRTTAPCHKPMSRAHGKASVALDCAAHLATQIQHDLRYLTRSTCIKIATPDWAVIRNAHARVGAAKRSARTRPSSTAQQVCVGIPLLRRVPQPPCVLKHR